MYRSRLTLTIVSLFIIMLSACVFTGQDTDKRINLNAPLPVDPNLIQGQLDNGLKYFIKENHKPENRAELRLVINAG